MFKSLILSSLRYLITPTAPISARQPSISQNLWKTFYIACTAFKSRYSIFFIKFENSHVKNSHKIKRQVGVVCTENCYQWKRRKMKNGPQVMNVSGFLSRRRNSIITSTHPYDTALFCTFCTEAFPAIKTSFNNIKQHFLYCSFKAQLLYYGSSGRLKWSTEERRPVGQGIYVNLSYHSDACGVSRGTFRWKISAKKSFLERHFPSIT